MPSEKQIDAAQKVFLDARPYMGSRELAALILTAAEQAEPAPAARSGAVKVDELAEEIRRVDGNNSLGAGALAEALMPFLTALEPAEPATDAEPVAWLMNGKGENWEERNVITFDKETADMKAATEWWTVEPLFTRPPESRLREALEGLIKLNDEHSPFGGEMHQDRIDRAWDAARAALAEGADHERS